MAKGVKIKYVYVPADKDYPIQELTYSGPNPELGNDTFSENLKTFFATGKMPETGGCLKSPGNEGSSGNVNKDILIENMKQQVGAENIDKLPEDMLQKLMESTQLDIFPILLPTKEAKQLGISIYVDDKGVSKKYQENVRLTQLAHTVGYKTQLFLGDGFIGRMHDNEVDDIWERVNFTLKEMSSDAEWVKVATTQVKTKGAEVENFKNMNLSNNAMAINGTAGYVGKESGSDKKEYWSFSARDGKEEYELTFPCVSDKRKVVVVFKNKSLYVEYDGKEWFGHRSAEIDQQRKTENTDTGCTIEEITDNVVGNQTVSEVPANLLDLPKDPKKTGALLWDAVDVEDCTWTIVDKTLQVTLCKAKEAKWSGALKIER